MLGRNRFFRLERTKGGTRLVRSNFFQIWGKPWGARLVRNICSRFIIIILFLGWGGGRGVWGL